MSRHTVLAARTAELLVAGHRLAEAALAVQVTTRRDSLILYFSALAYRIAEDALVAAGKPAARKWRRRSRAEPRP